MMCVASPMCPYNGRADFYVFCILFRTLSDGHYRHVHLIHLYKPRGLFQCTKAAKEHQQYSNAKMVHLLIILYRMYIKHVHT